MNTATLKPRPESAHWYTKDGEPKHTVPKKKDGEPRPTTVRDAKKLDLLPSVTTVLRGGLPTPYGLQLWKLRMLLDHALTTERRPDEDDEAYVSRIQRDYEAAKATAPDLGTEVHAMLADYYSGRGSEYGYSSEAYEIGSVARQYMEPVIDDVVAVERTVVGAGYAGTVDLVYYDVIGNLVLLDWKTQEPKDGKVRVRDDWVYQLAAYCEAWMRTCTGVLPDICANLILPTDGSQPYWKPYSFEELKWGWDVFVSALRTYRLLNGFE